MNHIQMLELAAKAAGYDVVFVHDNKIPMRRDVQNRKGMKVWNPRADDGDSRRLEVALMMTVCQHEKAVTAHVGGDFLGQVDVVGCRHDATRLAVLRCAAEIGKVMP